MDASVTNTGIDCGGSMILLGIIYLVCFKEQPKYVGQVLQTERRYNSECRSKYDSPEKLLRERMHGHKVSANSERKGCRVFKSAIRKYGFETFTFKIIETFYAQTEDKLREKANELEIAAIKQYNTLVPNGYNLTEGGNQPKLSEETCVLLSAAGKARKGKYTETARKNMSTALMGHPVTPETCSLISQRCKETMTDERRKQISERNSKITSSQKDEIVTDYSNDMSVSDLANKYGVCITTITNCLKQRGINVVWGKGGHYASGENHPQAKHSRETICAIYLRKSSENGAGRATAKEFGVSPQMVSKIWMGKQWSSITGASTPN